MCRRVSPTNYMNRPLQLFSLFLKNPSAQTCAVISRSRFVSLETLLGSTYKSRPGGPTNLSAKRGLGLADSDAYIDLCFRWLGGQPKAYRPIKRQSRYAGFCLKGSTGQT
jgi:hypothetical protein